MKIVILPSAEEDLELGYHFYEKQEPGIGSYFLDSLFADIDSLQLHAGIHRRHGELYRLQSRRFPFWIYYQLEDEIVVIRAVLDSRQDPLKIRRREKREQP